jgi:hypothetical protein
MKYTEFTYTDAKGKVTQRKVLVIQEPSNKLMGIDVSEIDEDDRKAFAEEYDDLLQQFIDAVEDLKTDFDLTHSLRQFIETNIKDRV